MASGSKSSKGGSGRPDAARTERRRAALERRRAHARRLADAQRHRRRSRLLRIGLVAVLVLLAVGAAGVVVVNRNSGGGSKASSDLPATLSAELVDANPGSLTITPPAAFAVTYRVDSAASANGPASVATEEITVQRPFDGKVVGKQGAPPGTTVQFQDVSNLGVISDQSQGSDVQVQQTLPRTAIGDLRLDASLDELVADGMLVPRERRRALGRECQVYRTGQPLETLTLTKPTATDYADACIDASGLMLEEVVVSSGKVSAHVTAVSIDDTNPPAAGTFAVSGTPLALDAGGSALLPIATATAPVAGYWHLDTPPAGYTLQGRYLLKEPAKTDTSPSTSDASTSTTVAPASNDSYVDVYVNGKDTIIVHQGVVASEPNPSDAQNGKDVTVGTLGAAKLAPTLTGAALVAHPAAPAGWFVEVTGTVPTATLQTVATALHS